MSHDQVDELLVEWELARQSGRELLSSDLCQKAPHLQESVERQIAVLRQTSWMLDDPVSEPLDTNLLSFVSRTTRKTGESGGESAFNGTLVAPVPDDTGSESEVSSVDNSASDFEYSEPLFELPGFQIIDELGRGGFGVVYRARDKKLNRHVAIKLPIIDDPKRRDAYIKEARNAASVDVPGIVPVLQIGTTAGEVPFVVQKLIDGSALSDILKNGGHTLPIPSHSHDGRRLQRGRFGARATLGTP